MQKANTKSSRSRRRRKGASSALALLNDASAYAGQVKFRSAFPGSSDILATTVTTGVIADVQTFDVTNDVSNWSTRFAATFDEYRVLGIDVLIRPVSASVGVTRFWFDEKDTGNAPTAAQAQERVGITLPNTNANPKADTLLSWRAKDLLDLHYTAIGTASTPVAFKTYTSLSVWGAPIAVTNLWIIQSTYHVEFRGLK